MAICLTYCFSGSSINSFEISGAFTSSKSILVFDEGIILGFSIVVSILWV